LFLLRLVCIGTFFLTSGIFLNVVGYYCDGNAATVSPNDTDHAGGPVVQPSATDAKAASRASDGSTHD
jgi:hypothetical protein